MAISANAIARGAVAAVGVILLAIVTQTWWADQSALAPAAGDSTRRACPSVGCRRRRDLAFG